MVELGVASGAFAAEVLSSWPGCQYTGIDRWSDHHDKREMERALRRLQPFSGRSRLIRGTFAENVDGFADASIDWTYIDGYAHTGQEGGATLVDWWRKTRHRGLFSGHDYSQRWANTKREVDAFAAMVRSPVTVIDEDKGFPSWAIIRPAPDATTTVLVGNGPSLLRQNLGAAIDRFERVVRFNAYRLRGFESCVGTRTSVWSTFGRGALPGDSCPSPPQAVLQIYSNERPALSGLPTTNLTSAFWLHAAGRVRAASARSKDDKTKIIPSSGLIVALYYLDIVGCARIALAGIDHFAKTQSGQHHYWNPLKFIAPPEHDGDAERRVLEQYGARVERLTA